MTGLGRRHPQGYLPGLPGLLGSLALAVLAMGLDGKVTSSVFAQDADSRIQRLGSIQDGEISESSGLAAGPLKDSYWTINDSGDGAKLYLLRDSGKRLATFTLRDTRNVDWECMARFRLGNVSWLVIGDVGDNARNRKSCQLYFVREPRANEIAQRTRPLNAFKYEFVYQLDNQQPSSAVGQPVQPPILGTPGAPGRISLDCEAMSVDTRANEIWLVEKIFITDRRKLEPRVFALPLPVKSLQRFNPRAVQARPRRTISKQPAKTELPAARMIGEFPVRNVTGMAFSPDGKKLIIRNYLNAHLYRLRVGDSWRKTLQTVRPEVVTLPLQRQGEAVCFTPDSKALVLTSEVEGQPIWRVQLD